MRRGRPTTLLSRPEPGARGRARSGRVDAPWSSTSAGPCPWTGRAVVRTDPWLVIAPGAAIAVTVIAVSLAGDVLAARLRSRS